MPIFPNDWSGWIAQRCAVIIVCAYTVNIVARGFILALGLILELGAI